MAFLQIESANPNFSYILKKNPASGMLVKPNRKGRLFAWYSNPTVFNIYFRDSDMEVSYSGEDFEYMDATRYNAPMFLNNAFSEFLNHMKKVDAKDIVGYENVLIINQMRCKPHSLDKFKFHFMSLGYDFKFDEVAYRNYRIEIKTQNTLRELINMGQLLSIFNSLLNNDLEHVSDDDIDKYIACLKVIDSPYYFRHLFKLYFLKTEKLFKKYKELIEKSEKEKIEFEFGSTIMQRISAIKRRIDFKYPIIDIGCGTGEYVREFAPKLKDGIEYHAIDIDEGRIEAVRRLCRRKEILNVSVWLSVDEFISGGSVKNANIIMTEVVEHMTKDDAGKLINKILGWQFKSLIITTPNKTFNVNYQLLEEDMRHDEHVFEMTKEEFGKWIDELVIEFSKATNGNDDYFNIKFFDIGDCVDNLRPTSAVIIEKRK